VQYNLLEGYIAVLPDVPSMEIYFKIISEEVKMKKSNVMFLAFLILLFISFLSLYAPAYANPGLEVVPLQHDFGDVSIGSSSTSIITISNLWWGDLTINEFSVQPGSSPDFSITSESPTGSVIHSGMSLYVEVTYTPSSVGEGLASIEIDWSNGETGVEHVNLSGIGVESQPPPVTIEDILAFFDESLANGTLVGNGSGNSAVHKLNALRNMLLEISRLIDEGEYEGACHQLYSAYKHCDSQPRPKDFVQGFAVWELANIIWYLMMDLECEQCLTKHSASMFDQEIGSVLKRYFLAQNHPNPFNPTTTINYQIPELSFVTIKVYDVLGSEVVTLVNEEKTIGSYEVELNGRDLTSGIYIYRITAGTYVETKKMVLLK
jgi:hypothetical protein